MASGSFQGSIYSNHYRLIVEWTSTANVSNNQSSVVATVKLQMDSSYSLYVGSRTVTVNINGTNRTFTAPSISSGGGQTITLGTCSAVTVTHDSDGTKSITITVTYPIQATLSGTYYSQIVASKTVALDNIPRQATITSAPNFNDTQNPVLEYSNPAGTAVSSLQACISLDNSTDNIAYRTIRRSLTSYTFELTDAERNVLRQATPNSKTMTVYFIVKSVIGSETYYSSQAVTFSIINANPTIGSIAYSDTNSTTVAITNNNQAIIRNKSNLVFAFTNINALKYATLTMIKVTINSVTKTLTLGSSSTSISNTALNFGTLNVASNISASIQVIDSRGNSTTYTKTIIVYDWVLPSAIITLERLNNFYSETHITIDADYSSLNGQNTLTIQYRYKKTTDNTWSSYVTAQDNVQSVFTADNSYEWNVQVKLTDLLGTTTYNLTLSKGVPIIYFDRILNSTGFNCFPDEENAVQLSNGVNIAYDTDWVDMSSYVNTTYFSPRSGMPPRARRIGNVVYWRGEVYCSTAPSTDTAQIMQNIPEQFRPSAQFSSGGVTNGMRTFFMYIQSSGNITVKEAQNIATQGNTTGYSLCFISGYLTGANTLNE